jgi:sugar lactone lactonase YvrE
MRSLATPVLFLTILLSALSAAAQDSYYSTKLERKWIAEDGLSIPESACYNKKENTIYVSNIVGMHNIKDGVGYISRLNVKGELLQKEWVIGLNAPKGICCNKKSLFVTDIDRVVEVDLKTGQIKKSYQNSKSKSLNDATVASDGTVYISDSGGDCIFRVGKDSLEVFLQSPDLERMNGILAADRLLYLGSKNNMITVSQKTKAITVVAEGVGYLDGIVKIGRNKFVTSDFKGMVQYIEPGKIAELLLKTTNVPINAADLGYIPSQKLLLVPTFNDNKINAYKLDF